MGSGCAQVSEPHGLVTDMPGYNTVSGEKIELQSPVGKLGKLQGKILHVRLRSTGIGSCGGSGGRCIQRLYCIIATLQPVTFQ